MLSVCAMHDLFDQLLMDGEAAIEQLIAQRVQENVELEFKTKANSDNGELTKDDRKNLGIALSALSNSMGGVLVWGVVAAKNEDGVDCASDRSPIAQIEKFKSEIERAISQAIMPRHDGIRVSMIKRSAAPNSGYLVIQVERSERRPHRCEFAGEKQYFKRIGDSSIAMEHYDIEDSFKRIVVPSLGVEYNLSSAGQRSNFDGILIGKLKVSVDLVNHSSVSARYPYLMITDTSGIKPEGFAIHRGLQQAPGFFNGGADDVIHPDLRLHALNLEREFRIGGVPGAVFLSRGTLQPAMTFTFQCGCLNSRPTFGTCVIEEGEVAAAMGLVIVVPDT
jgi:hypothetical protein